MVDTACIEYIGEDDLKPSTWLDLASKATKTVARLSVSRYDHGVSANRIYYGTGWLIGKQHLITNHHVINARDPNEENASEDDLKLQAKKTLVQFDCYNSVVCCKVDVDSLVAFCSSTGESDLDFAILKLSAPFREPLTLDPNYVPAHFGCSEVPVNIIQHPDRGAQKIGFRNNAVYDVEDTNLLYFSDTSEGSSGSPVLCDDWRVVALHKYATDLKKPATYQGLDVYRVNVGTRIDCIIVYLKNNAPKIWAEINALVH